VNNQEGMQAIEYDAGEGCVAPSVETAQDGSYGLTRPLFIYAKVESLQTKPYVADFVTFYLDTVNDVIGDVGYIEAPEEDIAPGRDAVEAVIAGEEPPSTGSEAMTSEAAS